MMSLVDKVADKLPRSSILQLKENATPRQSIRALTHDVGFLFLPLFGDRIIYDYAMAVPVWKPVLMGAYLAKYVALTSQLYLITH